MILTPPMPFQMSRHGWIHVMYDQDIWIPVPSVFPEGLDRDSWANLYADEWWSQSGQPYGRRELRGMTRMLHDVHAYAYSNLAMHLGYLHFPEPATAPLLVSFGIWEAAGERNDQLRFLARADDPTLVQAPTVEHFSTEGLGPGLRALCYTRSQANVITGHLNYAWRSEELRTAVRMFTGCPDLGRLERAAADINELARSVTWVPWEREDA